MVPIIITPYPTKYKSEIRKGIRILNSFLEIIPKVTNEVRS